MNPKYLLLAGVLQLLTLFVIAPVLAVAIAYAAWKRRLGNVNTARFAILAIASGVAAFLLFGIAKWMNVDIRTPQYFLQLACVLLSGVLFGISMGCGFSALLGFGRWHQRTRLGDADAGR